MDTNEDIMRDEYMKKYGLTSEAYVMLEDERAKSHLTDQSRSLEQLRDHVDILRGDIEQLRKRVNMLDGYLGHYPQIHTQLSLMYKALGLAITHANSTETEVISAKDEVYEKAKELQKAAAIREIQRDCPDYDPEKDKPVIIEGGKPFYKYAANDSETYLGQYYELSDIYDIWYDSEGPEYVLVHGDVVQLEDGNWTRYIVHSNWKDEALQAARELAQKRGLLPMYEHDCNHCIFLGGYKVPEKSTWNFGDATHLDLYAHEQDDKWIELIARWGNEGSEYYSDSLGLHTHELRNPAIREARERYYAQKGLA